MVFVHEKKTATMPASCDSFDAKPQTFSKSLAHYMNSDVKIGIYYILWYKLFFIWLSRPWVLFSVEWSWQPCFHHTSKGRSSANNSKFGFALENLCKWSMFCIRFPFVFLWDWLGSRRQWPAPPHRKFWDGFGRRSDLPSANLGIGRSWWRVWRGWKVGVQRHSHRSFGVFLTVYLRSTPHPGCWLVTTGIVTCLIGGGVDLRYIHWRLQPRNVNTGLTNTLFV